jgi:hypothetical protein
MAALGAMGTVAKRVTAIQDGWGTDWGCRVQGKRVSSTVETSSHTSEEAGANRIGFVVTLVLIVLVIVSLPFVVMSLIEEAREQSRTAVYDVFTGQELDFITAVPDDGAFVNIAVTDVDETRRMASLLVSGSRACEAPCDPVVAQFFAIGEDTARRLGLPPSASITLPDQPGPYSEVIALPVAGWPQRYPFDTYELTLGIAAEGIQADGTRTPLAAEALREQHVFVTVEDTVSRLTMTAPTPLDPDSVTVAGAAVPFFAVDRLSWHRPLYIRFLAVLLVLLIGASAVFALSLQDLQSLLLGIGGIILGVWGVRSVVVRTEMPDLTAIDVALAFIILFLLLALAIRAARHFYSQSGFRASR